MFERLDNCPLCNSGHFSNYIICKDHTVSQDNFAIVKCDDCDFYFTNPRPQAKVLDQYYESEEYISHQDKSNNLVNAIYRIARKFTLKSKQKLINKETPKGKLLDIGCGTGHFLSTMANNGWAVTGVEPNYTARSQAGENQFTVHNHIDEVPTTETFQAITLWHVLEHIPDLNNQLKKINKLLDKKGTLFIAVPNIESKDTQIYKEMWAAYDVPRHLYHFSQKTMKALMKKHGFKIASVRPMKLDAFYVSLLSEKYQGTGLAGYYKAFFNGLKSNQYAKKHNNNYSSLIYIIRKS